MVDPALMNFHSFRRFRNGMDSPGTWGILLLPLILGAAVGTMAGADALLGSRYPIRLFDENLFRLFPWIGSVALFLLLLIGSLVYVKRDGIFSRRYTIAAVLLVVPGLLGGINYGPLDPSDVAFLASFLFWISVSLIERRPLRTPLSFLALLTGLAVFMLVSIVNGRITSILSSHTLVTKLVLFTLITNIIATHRDHRFALKTFVACVFLSAVLAIASEIVYLAFDTALTCDDLPQFHFKDTPFGRMLRVTAFLPTAQGLGHVLILATGLGLFMPLSTAKRITLLLTLWISAAFTFTTGAYITIGIVVLLSIFIRRPERSIHYASALLLIVLLAYMTGMLAWAYERIIIPLGSKGIEDRTEYIRVGLGILKQHPLVGFGFKNLGRVFHTAIHNAYLQTAADIGIFGGLIFGILVFSVMIRSGILAMRTRDPEQKSWMKGLFLGAIGMSIHFLFEPFYDNTMSWVYMGLVASGLIIYSGSRAGYGNAHEPQG